MRIPSGVTDQYIYFVAVDATDFATRETGLSSFTVYRSRNGGAAAAMTTPTINETDATNMPGVYELLLDEDMTIDAGDDSQEMVFHITHAGMAPVTRTIELYRPKITAGNTLDVTATGAAGIDWGNVENQSTSVNLSATTTNLVNTCTTNTDMVAAAPTAAQNADAVWDELQSGHTTADTFGALATEIATIDTNVDAVLVDTGTTLPATLATIDSNVDAILVDTGTTIPGTLTTIDTVVDGIQADLDNGTDGLGAIKTAVDAVPTATANADALLNRDMSAVSDTTARSPLNALRFLRNKWSVSGTTLTVTKEDDATSAWTATVTTDATADPITGNDPA